jgi:hypothetical protein
VRIIEGSGVHKRRLQQKAREELTKDIADNQLNTFPLVLRTDDVTTALPTLLQSYGIGPMRANIVLTNWYGQSGTGLPGLAALKFGRNLRSAFQQGYNLVLLHFDATQWQELLDSERDGRRIDVWWCADASSRLMLLFAYLLTRHHAWQKADIRVLTTGTGHRLVQAKENMVKILEESRIDAQPQIVATMDAQTIKTESNASSLVFLPFEIKNYNLTDRQGYSLQRILPNLPTTALVMAAEEIDLDAEPEKGAAGELAVAMDRLQEAEQRLTKPEKNAARTKQAVEDLKTKIDAAAADGADSETLQALKDRLNQAEQDAEEAFRKAAKVKSKADDAADTVTQLGGSIE